MIRIAVCAVVVLGLVHSAVNAKEKTLSPHAEHLKVFEPLIGKSNGTFVDGDTTVKGEREMKWGPRNAYLEVKVTWHADPATAPEGAPNWTAPICVDLLEKNRVFCEITFREYRT